MIFGPTFSPTELAPEMIEPQEYPEYKPLVKDSDTGQSLVQDSGNDAISQLARQLNLKLSDDTKDYLWQYYLNEKSNDRAWMRSMDASNTQYQRAVADLKAAGLNPFLAISSLSGSAPTASGSTVQGGLINQRQSQKESNAINKQEADQNAALGIVKVIAMIAAAVIYAMAMA